MELDALDRLRSYWELLDESEDVEEIFPGLEWLDESLIQTLPDETCWPPSFTGTLRVASLIIDLSSLLERNTFRCLRVNCLQPNMLIIDR